MKLNRTSNEKQIWNYYSVSGFQNYGLKSKMHSKLMEFLETF